jgi:colicin import membrane protein
LQPQLHNDFQKYPSERGKGIVVSAMIHLLLFLLLLFVAFTVPPSPVTEAGIMVNFGTGETGQGDIEPSPPALKDVSSNIPLPPPAIKQKVSSPPPSVAKVKTKEESLLTQKSDEAPVVKEVDPAAEKKKLEKIEADRKLREQIKEENKRKADEEAERKRIEAEQQRQSDIMNRTKNALANSKNRGTSSTSEGITGGTGNQGVPTGSVDSRVRGPGGSAGNGSGIGPGGNGVSFDLGGRGFLNLPQPKYDYQGEGKVVVEVSVDRNGKVVEATAGKKGSTILDEYLLKVARDAAMEARFAVKPDAPVIQKGTITYNFRLK